MEGPPKEGVDPDRRVMFWLAPILYCTDLVEGFIPIHLQVDTTSRAGCIASRRSLRSINVARYNVCVT